MILHICGDTRDRIAVDLAQRPGLLPLRVQGQPPRKARWAAGDRIALMGNINNPRTLLHGTPGRRGGRGGASACGAGIEIIAPECAVPLTTPTENLRAITEAARGETG